MPSLPVPFADIKHTVQVWHDVLSDGWEPRPQMGQPGALGELSVRIGVSRNALQNRLDTAVAPGITVRDWRPVEPEFTAGVLRRYRRYDDDFVKAEKAFAPPTQSSAGARPPAAPMTPPGRGKRALAPPRHPGAPPDRAVPVSTIDELISKVIPVLRRGPLTLDELITKLGADASDTSLAIASAIKNGASIDFRGGYWHLDDAPAMGSQHERGDNTPLRLVTDHDGRLRFAAVADTHLCSKYAREDCLNDFYDEVERRGITRVLHAGNWIDGEAPFNRHDLLVHGMDSQMQYLAKNYPCRDRAYPVNAHNP